MRDQGIGAWPARRARMTPDKPALVVGERTITYADLERRVNALAHGLRARGVQRGDRVAYLGLNSDALVETLFAVARLGAVFLPLNTRLAPPELAWIVDDAGASVLVVDAAHHLPHEGLDVEVLSVDSDADGTAVLAEDGARIDEPIGLDDLFMIQYTSGTSGRPKGVMLSHGNVTWNVYNLLVDVDVRNDEVALVTAPLFHTAALNQILLPCVLKGGTALVEARFDPDRALRLIEEHGVTLLFGVTSMYLALAQAPGWQTADLSTLRSALSGGAPIPEALLHTWLERGLMIVQGYGLTEASPGTTMLRAEDGVRLLGSAGTACFFTDVRLVGPDLADVAVGEPGEVLVQGPNVSAGYWRNPEATAAAFVEVDGESGWLRTGDLAVSDAQGNLRIVDRLKDMFISGGENVYPAEVEAALYTHDAVAECAVIGVPDQKWGEVGRAVVVLREDAAARGVDETALLAHLEGRLARYKIPRSVVLTEALPHNASGKLLRARLRSTQGEDQNP